MRSDLGYRSVESSSASSPSSPRPAPSHARRTLFRLFGWMLVPELLAPAVWALCISPNLRRIVVLAVACGVLLLLFASPWLPEGLFPVRGRWLRRMLAGLALLGIAYASPRAGLQRVLTYGWDLRQVQARVGRILEDRPGVPLPRWLVELPLPGPVGAVPVSVLLTAAGCMALFQFKLVWDDLGREKRASDDP